MPESSATASHVQRGLLLVIGSAFVWSFGGAIARFIATGDSWAIVFWRSAFAALFLLAFMLARDGPRGTVALFRNMGLPGVGVGVCFAIGSVSFVLALAHTTIANILLIQAGAPLVAALLAWVFFRERTSPATWAAIAAVITGVAIMVSDSLSGTVSPLGDGLALMIAIAISSAIVITRRHAHIRMTPAVFLATIIGAVLSAFFIKTYIVSLGDLALLFAFGALNLGLGLAFFVTGARLIPAALAALLGTLETVLGPVWVWLIHNEVPSRATIIGGAVVFAALLAHLLFNWRRR